MKQLFFTKLSGAGNDFILFDSTNNSELSLKPQIIRQICDRRFGIGADGLILFSEANDYAFDMKYYNADGTSGSLCANGARCALEYGFETGRVFDKKVNFVSNGTEYAGEILEKELVKFYLNPPKNFKYNFKIKAYAQLINASYVDTGSPQVVIKISDILAEPKNPGSFFRKIEDVPVYQIGREIRYSPDFAPEGTNVNFINVTEEHIQIRTYERGVENETLSCGTGSVGAALISFVNDNLKTPIKLRAKSGDILSVDFKVENQKVSGLSLTGPAKIIFKGEITI